MRRFEDLPLDCIGVIFGFINLKDLVKFRCVCGEWNSVIMNSDVPKNMMVDITDVGNYSTKNCIERFENLTITAIVDYKDSDIYDAELPGLPTSVLYIYFTLERFGFWKKSLMKLKCLGYLTRMDLINTTFHSHNRNIVLRYMTYIISKNMINDKYYISDYLYKHGIRKIIYYGTPSKKIVELCKKHKLDIKIYDDEGGLNYFDKLMRK
jgi:hypothetical protein